MVGLYLCVILIISFYYSRTNAYSRQLKCEYINSTNQKWFFLLSMLMTINVTKYNLYTYYIIMLTIQITKEIINKKTIYIMYRIINI